MKIYLIVMIVLYSLTIFVKTANLLTKSFPYKQDKTIGETTLELLITIGMCVWVLSLLGWI